MKKDMCEFVKSLRENPLQGFSINIYFPYIGIGISPWLVINNPLPL